jgi:hypothetical protein
MPIDERRRDDITAAVGAYNEANPLTPLPRNAARLLVAMFPTDDVCQRRLEAIVADGFSARMLPGTLRRLVDAGFLTRQRGASRVPDAWRLHLLPRRQP